MHIRLLAILILGLTCSRVYAGGVVSQIEMFGSYLSGQYNGNANLTDIEKSNKPQFPIGLKFVLNLSNTNFNKGFPKPSTPIETSWKTGFTGGAFLEFPILNNVSIQQEYLYTYLRSELKEEEIEYRLGYISLPILLKLKINSRLSVVAGPQVDVLIHAKEHFNSRSSNIIHDVEERQIGAAFGVSYNLTKALGFEARFVHGLNHIGMRQTGYTREFKLEQFQIGINARLL